MNVERPLRRNGLSMPSIPTDAHAGQSLLMDPHGDLAAFHLYELVKPEGGLSWDALTSDQRAQYRGLIAVAARQTDVTAIRAAYERAAYGLAAQAGWSWPACTPSIRQSLRCDALAAVRAFQWQLTNGDAALDTLTLSLVAEEPPPGEGVTGDGRL